MNPQEAINDQIKQLQDYERQLNAEKQNLSLAQGGYNSQAGSGISQIQNSIVEWQLDLSKEFELIYHQLRGHIIKRDKEGNEFWTPSEDPEQQLLNEKGAQEVEKIIRNYLNKNTLLSNFDIKIINKRVGEFAHRLRRFIYLNYEDFGLDTYYKQKHFEMLVMNIVDMIESAYLRAMGGGERQSLTTIRQVIQTESFDQNKVMNQVPHITRGGGSKLNPVNWFKG